MLHGRIIRPPAIGREAGFGRRISIRGIPGVRVVRIESFLGVVAQGRVGRGRAAARAESDLDATGRAPGSDGLERYVRQRRRPRRAVVNQGDPAAMPCREETLGHLFLAVPEPRFAGPSCAVADVRDGAHGLDRLPGNLSACAPTWRESSASRWKKCA